MLRANATLTVLELASNLIDADGISGFAEALKVNTGERAPSE
jgi:hypothetical protein